MSKLGNGIRNRLKCPSCNSLRIAGTQNRFKCQKCGFTHNTHSSVPKNLLIFQIKGTTNKGMSESTLELAKRFNVKEVKKKT